jgi:hypothetical protein
METAIKETESRILIVDNITYLKSETEKPRLWMKHLKALKLNSPSILARPHPKMKADQQGTICKAQRC